MAFIEQLPSREAMRKIRRKERSNKPRGRPVGWRKYQDDTEKPSFTTIRVYSSYKLKLESFRREDENLADTIFRLDNSQLETIKRQAEEIKRLQSQLAGLRGNIQ